MIARVAAAIAMLVSTANGQAGLTEQEASFVRGMGPWPPVWERDPSNRYSGHSGAISFGKALFFDTRLSRDNDRACATCHLPDMAYGDGLTRSVGIAVSDRNAPSLANLRHFRWYGWDGRSDNLWAQSIRPILEPGELALTERQLADRVREYDDLAEAYASVFKTQASDEDPTTVLVGVGKALAAFQETLITPATRFDAFWMRFVRGEAAPDFPTEAMRGLKLFVGKARCAVCHFGPAFTSGESHDIGRPYFVDGTRVDPGRFGGLQAFFRSPFTRAGPFSDEPENDRDRAPGAFVELMPRNWGEFRVPSLRNVTRTAPYMHDGSLATLEDVLRHYSDVDPERLHADGETIIRPLNLSDREKTDIIAFLATLEGDPVEP